ncbi:MAG: iron ABC transporter substrate-binding protein [Euzebyales bacterium]|jgi:iron(III) transport system substrate-binding protein|nr:iron ABC transporter substrate-binding protein [Euzebyales bacterium]
MLPVAPLRKFLARTAAVALLAIVASACGGDSTETGADADVGAGDAAAGADTTTGPAPTEAATTAAATEAPEPTDEGATAAATDDATAADGEPLTVYSGRNEELVGPLLDEFTAATGIGVEIRYGDTAELAATILEEGESSPADVYFAQDAGALGALRAEGRLTELAPEQLDRVEDRFQATDGTWVGVSGRARTIVYNTAEVTDEELPNSVLELTDDTYAGRVGWAPTNGSFQAFVTAMRAELGDDETATWVEGMVANDVSVYENNTAIVEAVGRGEIAFGLVNHYYLYRFLDEDPSFPAANGFLPGGDVGALVNVAGAGVLTTTDQPEEAEAFIAYLLSDESQEYFSTKTFEYPLVTGIPADDRLPALGEIETPDLDLSDLDDLQGTLELLRESGALT